LAPGAYAFFGLRPWLRDPLIRHDSILNTIPDEAARDRLVARLDLAASVPLDTLAYRWDIVLRGTRATVFENKLQGN
jgi:protocatechuate 3,4-dioxygenase beta subunit